MKTITQVTLIVFLLSLLVLGIATLLQAQGLLPTDLTLLLTDPTIQLNAVMLSPDTTATASPARDPGVRGGPAGAGGAIVGLTARELEFFNTGQPDFDTAASNNNLIFRIPTPVFGAGLIDQIPDRVLLANQAANASTKQQFGVGGHPNLAVSGRTITGRTNNNGNDGTIARFGWKAQNQTLLMFSGEAYNVEMGVTNELFQQEREQGSKCQYVTVPNDVADTGLRDTPAGLSAIEKFAFFQRFQAHMSAGDSTFGPSEANAVIVNFNKLSEKKKQDLLNFLRSL